MTDVTLPLTFSLRAFSTPKDGSRDAEYEDAWAATEAGEVSSFVTASSALTVAVSDGASAAIFARDWARRLVAAFTTGELGSDATDQKIAAVAVREGALWRTDVETKATSWHAQEKLQTGSAATLLVLTLSAIDRKWSAFAVGDVCLFLVRGGKLKYAFPVPKSTGFDDRPSLLSTEARAPFPTVKRFGNTLEPGDRLLLMTDAIAAWFLNDFEKKRRPWETLPSDPETFAAFVQGERDAAKMKNDDATMIEILVSESLPANNAAE